jgi:hypothetical protein
MGQALLRPEERVAEGHMIWNFFGQSDRADFSVAETTSNSSLPHQLVARAQARLCLELCVYHVCVCMYTYTQQLDARCARGALKRYICNSL